MAASLGEDSDFEADDSLTDTFTRASQHLPSLMPLDSQLLLNLYAYYKQGLEGRCNTPKPSWYDLKAKSKWEAWSKLGDMSQTDAKTRYIEEITKLDPNFKPDTTKQPSWVCVSTLQNTNEAACSLVDYVKDEDLAKVVAELKHCSNINALDEDGLGLIHWAADRGNGDILKTLLDSGADVNLVDADGQSALHYASSCDHVECIKVLLKHGAQKDLKNKEGECALDVAGDDTVKELLG